MAFDFASFGTQTASTAAKTGFDFDSFGSSSLPINAGLAQSSVTGEVPGAESAMFPATPLQNTNPAQAGKILPNVLKDAWDLLVSGGKAIVSIPGNIAGLYQESSDQAPSDNASRFDKYIPKPIIKASNAISNLFSSAGDTIKEVISGAVPQSAKEIINAKAISELPSEFNSLVKESGGYANALKYLDESMQGSLPEGISKYVDQIDRAGQAYINHPLIETLGYVGLKALAENPGALARETGKGLASTGELLAHPVKSLSDVANEVSTKVRLAKEAKLLKSEESNIARKAAKDAGIIDERARQIYDIEKNYSATRKAMDYSKDEGAESRMRVAETDVLVDAVDNNGIIDTKKSGGAIEQYKAQTIDGVEDTVYKNLIREGVKVNINEVAKELLKEIESSRLPPGDLENALTSGIRRELKGLSRKADEFGNIPVSEVQKAKINTTGHINYQTPPETATLAKAKARAYKNIVEIKYPEAKKINPELAKYYKDIELLENLNGKRVKGGKLGKYFAQITGNIAGGAVGGAIGGPLGAGVGTVVGGEVASAIKGKTLEGTFGRETGKVAPRNAILEEAKRVSNLPKDVDLTKPDPKVRAKSNVPRTKEIYRLENEIKNNVEAQQRAIKARDFVLVAKLKELYQFLVEKLKDIIKNKKIGLSTQDVTEGLDISTAGKIKGSHGLSAQDIMAKHPDINLKRDVPVTDVYGKKSVIPAGEALTPYELKGNKVLLQDGETYIVSRNQFQNIKGNAVSGEAKPFAPELKGTEETVKSDKVASAEETAQRLFSKKFTDLTTKEKMSVGAERAGTPSKYSQYQLPGGKNYKEVLIKAPIPKADFSEFKITEANPGAKKPFLVESPNSSKWVSTRVEAEAELAQIKKSYGAIQQENASFKSSHWDEPNVLSHLRLNERTYKGKKVTFMEELQSDWAREGRSKGFNDNVVLHEIKKVGDKYAVFNPQYPDNVSGGLSLKDAEKLKSELDAEVTRTGETKGVPNNPLLKNWQELSVKRALQEAVNNNSEYFAWINGEQTSARYNLATHLEDVKWSRPTKAQVPGTEIGKNITLKPQGLKSEIDISVDNKGKIVYGDKKEWNGKKLDEVLGKGLADKIMASEKGTLSGEGLKFGGEWASNLYDKQVANIVKDLTGAKVETMDMGLPVDNKTPTFVARQRTGIVDVTPENLRVGVEIIKDNGGQDMATLNQSEKYIITDVLGDGKFKAVPKHMYIWDSVKKAYEDKFNASLMKDYQETFDISTKKTTQQGIRLTPEIKAKIKGEAIQLKKPSGKSPF